MFQWYSAVYRPASLPSLVCSVRVCAADEQAARMCTRIIGEMAVWTLREMAEQREMEEL